MYVTSGRFVVNNVLCVYAATLNAFIIVFFHSLQRKGMLSRTFLAAKTFKECFRKKRELEQSLGSGK